MLSRERLSYLGGGGGGGAVCMAVTLSEVDAHMQIEGQSDVFFRRQFWRLTNQSKRRERRATATYETNRRYPSVRGSDPDAPTHTYAD